MIENIKAKAAKRILITLIIVPVINYAQKYTFFLETIQSKRIYPGYFSHFLFKKRASMESV